MLSPEDFLFIAFSVLCIVVQTLAQDPARTVWAVFAYNVHGDSTPAVLRQQQTLTALGAQNMFNVGSNFRARYIVGGASQAHETWIQSLNQHSLNPEQVTIHSTSDQFTEASAIAFAQGLYPPAGNSNQSFSYIDPTNILSNGSIIGSPLNDYQYPQIHASGSADPGSIFVAGEVDCDNHKELQSEYQKSAEFRHIESKSAAFYSEMYNIALAGVMSRDSVGYARAVDIYEYLEYNYLHNESLVAAIPAGTLQRARVLANQYTFATNGNVTDPGKYHDVRAIAGRTLSRFIIQSLLTNIETQGSAAKMTLVFGGVEPIVAFAGLSQLASQMNGQFFGIPVLGASMVLELFSINPKSPNVYPDSSDLYVRLLFRNSTSIHEGFTQYPVFGYSPSKIDLPFNDFAVALGEFMLPSIESWCEKCGSTKTFCVGAMDSSESSSKHRLSAAGAGAIGAAVTLAVIGALMGIAWACGLGISRRRKPIQTLGGFKGSGKLASDLDISFRGSTQKVPHDTSSGQGAILNHHQRMGSWELRSTGREPPVGLELDNERDVEDISAITEPVKCHQVL